jgi:hypothetical protein
VSPRDERRPSARFSWCLRSSANGKLEAAHPLPTARGGT